MGLAFMKTALITTTINVPEVLRLYRALDPDVRFFVAGDEKTPHLTVGKLCDEIGNAAYLSPEMQRHGYGLGYRCSELIGWNCIQRRNIALLEALRWGADTIVTIDDDNVCVNRSYFNDLRSRFEHPFVGLRGGLRGKWFNPCAFVSPPVPHRGFPYHQPESGDTALGFAVDAKVGVCAGMILGDPDVDAYYRMGRHPEVQTVGQVLQDGIVVDPHDVWTVFNSQNTSFVRELAPAMFMLPGLGRHDDIWASLITQRIMRETGHVTHFGKPFAYQTRNPHDNIKDLKAELYGMEHIIEFAEFLDTIDLGQAPVVNQVRLIFNRVPSSLLPPQAIDAGLAWCLDVERVL